MAKILRNDNKIITHLVQLSDIHVSKNTARHDEYKYVFNNLYQNMKDKLYKTTNFITVICGDTVNENSRLAPNQIELVKELFINLCNFSDVIVILGNHDMNMHDQSINSIEPIIKNTITKHNIFLLTENCNYVYNNIVFGVTTMHADVVTSPMKINNKINISLYHGTLHGCQLENGMTMSNNKLFTNKDFAGYDVVCLGDIHKFQYMNKNKTICYASSLIQQNVSESVIDHGYVLWDLETKLSKLVRYFRFSGSS